MNYTRLCACLFLITLPFLTLIPTLNGQSYETFTHSFTTTQTSIYTIGTRMATGVTNPLFNDTFTIRGGPDSCYKKEVGPFNLTKNQQVEAYLTSNVTIDFYIMDSTQYFAWWSAPSLVASCDPYYVAGDYFSQISISSLSLTYLVPENGSYYFGLTNDYSSGRTNTANLRFSADTFTPQTYTSTLSATQTQVMTLGTTGTLNLTESPQVTQLRASNQTGNIGEIILAVGLVAAVGLVLGRGSIKSVNRKISIR